MIRFPLCQTEKHIFVFPSNFQLFLSCIHLSTAKKVSTKIQVMVFFFFLENN